MARLPPSLLGDVVPLASAVLGVAFLPPSGGTSCLACPPGFCEFASGTQVFQTASEQTSNVTFCVLWCVFHFLQVLYLVCSCCMHKCLGEEEKSGRLTDGSSL